MRNSSALRLVVASIAVIVMWFNVLDFFFPEKNGSSEMIYGIDVSYCQQDVDWNVVKETGVEFAIIRCGFLRTDGTLEIDDKFHSHINGAVKSGMNTAVYVYSYVESVEGAAYGAKQVLDLIEPYDIKFVAFDIEYEPFYLSSSKSTNTSITRSFLEEIKSSKKTPVLYASKDFLKNNLEESELSECDKWVAQYNHENTYDGEWQIWQYSSSGTVEGISEAVDINMSKRDFWK